MCWISGYVAYASQKADCAVLENFSSALFVLLSNKTADSVLELLLNFNFNLKDLY